MRASVRRSDADGRTTLLLESLEAMASEVIPAHIELAARHPRTIRPLRLSRAPEQLSDAVDVTTYE